MLALANTGNVYSWGYGADGQLGQSSLYHFRSPKQVDHFEDHGATIVDIGCGGLYSAAVDDAGRLSFLDVNILQLAKMMGLGHVPARSVATTTISHVPHPAAVAPGTRTKRRNASVHLGAKHRTPQGPDVEVDHGEEKPEGRAGPILRARRTDSRCLWTPRRRTRRPNETRGRRCAKLRTGSSGGVVGECGG